MVAVAVFVGVFEGVFMGVSVPAGVLVKVSEAIGPVMPLSQVPQLVAMNRNGLANKSSIKIYFLFAISEIFFTVENMAPLFVCKLMVDRMPPLFGTLHFENRNMHD
jgi:hypothetical protein